MGSSPIVGYSLKTESEVNMKIQEIQLMIKYAGTSEELEQDIKDLPLHMRFMNEKYEIIDMDNEDDNLYRVVYSKENK